MDSVNECVIEWLKGQKVASLTIPSNTRMKSKILNLAKNHSEVTYLENKDGSIFAHCPVEWITVRPKRKISEEQKEFNREVLKRAREKRNQ